MTLRLTSTATVFESDPWTPAGEAILQLDAHDDAVVHVQARVSPDAMWATIATLRKGQAFARLAQLPFMKLVMTRNKAGELARVWDDA